MAVPGVVLAAAKILDPEEPPSLHPSLSAVGLLESPRNELWSAPLGIADSLLGESIVSVALAVVAYPDDRRWSVGCSTDYEILHVVDAAPAGNFAEVVVAAESIPS